MENKTKEQCIQELETSEANRKRAEDALRESEALCNTIFENMGGAMLIFDEDTIILRVNAGAVKLLGYSKEELEGKKSWKDFVKGKTPEKFTNVAHKNCELTLITGEGATKDITPTVTVIPGTKKWLASLLDRAERHRLETRLQQAQKMEAIGTLAGGITHDFNNILGAIIGYTELALIEADEGTKIKKYLEEAIRAELRAKDLIHQILTFSRQAAVEQKPVSIVPVITEALILMKASLPSTIEIKTHIEREVGTVKMDSTQIHQVVMNLCTNAAHAMGENGGTLEISLVPLEIDPLFANQHTGMHPGSYVRFTVSDTGCGMTADVMERIFDPYFTTKEKSEGTGLGLSVVHGIVARHDGAITVESEPGRGTAFHIYLPRFNHKVEKMEAKRVLPTGCEHILFVDDEPSLVDIGKQLLEHLGYRVTTMTSGTGALELFRSHPDRFDIVITDMTMPVITGDKLTSELLLIRPEIPIILCTGFSQRITQDRADQLGIKSLVMKPFTAHTLAVAVRQALDRNALLAKSLDPNDTIPLAF
ncbi:MAG: ATP-binding protein [Syntrophales bacterium]|nr:ATP-binding protein [Syntrophales bacterium]